MSSTGKLRIGIAEFAHQAVTFNPKLVTVADFRRRGLYRGAEMLRIRGPVMVGGMIKVCEADPAVELVPLIRACSLPTAGGRLADDALSTLVGWLLEEVEKAGPLDGVVISMAGTSVAESVDDVTGHILAALRGAIGPKARLVVCIDHHANVTRRMVAVTDLLSAFRTQPHDREETGIRSTQQLLDLIRNDRHLVCAYQKLPMIAPQERFLTAEAPMKEWFDLARTEEGRPGIYSVSTFPMQPWMDAAEGGWTSLVYADRGSGDLVRDACARLASKVWSLREQFWQNELVDVEGTVDRIAAMQSGLLVVCDSGDSMLGGSYGDSTVLLKRVLERAVTTPMALPVVDPAAVETLRQSRAGDVVTITVGGKVDTISGGGPVGVTGRLLAFSDGVAIADTPLGGMDFGAAALLEVGSIRLAILADRSYAVVLPALYQSLGVVIDDLRAVVVKTSGNFWGYDRWRTAFLRADTPGQTQSNLKGLAYTHLPRPIWPFDDLAEWKPAPLLVETPSL